jgi:protein-tyrosine-phosphatase/DNA-binding transcriptional ArsR family regulator
MDNLLLQPPEVLPMLAHPLRWSLVQALSASDRKVHELVASLQQPYNLVSYHLKLLRASNLVALRKSDADGRDLYYSLNPGKLQEGIQSVARSLYPGWVWKESKQMPVHPTPRRVLFLCTNNSARSQMAEGLLRKLGGDSYLVASAGSQPSDVHPDAIKVMSELGIDISKQRSKHLLELQDQSFDEVITVCDRVREVCFSYEFCIPTIHWSIPDPVRIQDPDERRQIFVRTARELERRIRQFLYLS